MPDAGSPPRGAAAAVAAGGALGALARWSVVVVAGAAAPWPTLAINAAGSFALAWLLGGPVARGLRRPLLLPFLATGVLGGFTTLSVYAVEPLLLAERGRPLAAAAYVGTGLVTAVAAARLGAAVARR